MQEKNRARTPLVGGIVQSPGENYLTQKACSKHSKIHPTTNLMFVVQFIELFLHVTVDILFRPVQQGVSSAYHFSLRIGNGRRLHKKKKKKPQQQLSIAILAGVTGQNRPQEKNRRYYQRMATAAGRYFNYYVSQTKLKITKDKTRPYVKFQNVLTRQWITDNGMDRTVSRAGRNK